MPKICQPVKNVVDIWVYFNNRKKLFLLGNVNHWIVGRQNKLQRKPLRLQEYDYSSPGYYFVTFNVKNREPMFGAIAEDKMVVNGFGEIVRDCIVTVPDHFPDAEIVEFVVMPDHVHLVVAIGRGQACLTPTDGEIKPNLKKLPVIIGSIKSSITREIGKRYDWHGFKWQRSFHDRIIRDEKELFRIREYVCLNPVLGRG